MSRVHLTLRATAIAGLLILLPGATGPCGGGSSSFSLTLNMVGEGSITVTPPGQTYTAGDLPATVDFDASTQVVLSAAAAAGWRFAAWEEDLVGTVSPAILTVSGRNEITVRFEAVGPDDDDDEGSEANPDLGDVATIVAQGIHGGMDYEAVAQSAAAYLKTLDSVVDAGVAAGGKGAWAELASGGWQLVALDPYALEEEEGLDEAGRRALASCRRLNFERPAPQVRRQLRSHPSRPMIFAQIRPSSVLPTYLALHDMAIEAGYTDAIRDPDESGQRHYGSIDWFKTLGQYGVVYLQTDCLGWNPSNLSEPPTYWALMTTEKYTAARQQQLADDIRQGYIMPAIAVVGFNRVTGEPIFEHRYFVSQHFLRRNGSNFGPDSFVYIDGCGTWEGYDLADSDLLNVLRYEKNAAAVMGWDMQPSSSGAYEAAAYFFSRMLGINRGDAPTPPNRPFPLDAVFDRMEEQTLDRTASAAMLADSDDPLAPLVEAQLAYSGGDDDLLWRPTISTMYVDPADEHLVINGDFADDEPAVTIGGEALEVLEADRETILARIGPHDAGEVIVSAGENLHSNPRPLSAWSGQFELAGEADTNSGPAIDGSITARFRGDVGDVRLAGPDVAPDTLESGPVSVANTSMMCEPDTQMQVEFKGTFTDEYGCTWTWSGSATGKLNASDSDTAGYLAMSLGVDATGQVGNGKGFCRIDVFAEGADYVRTCPGGTPTSGTQAVHLSARVDVNVAHDGGVSGASGSLDQSTDAHVILTVPSMTPEHPFTAEDPA